MVWTTRDEALSVKRREAAILLTPGRLEFVVLERHRPERGIVTALDPSAWDTAWGAGLRPLDDALMQSVLQMQAEGLDVSVFHAGPDAMVQMLGLPGKRGDARRAALLGLSEHCGRALAGCPHGVSLIGRDAEGDPALSHFITCADTEQSARALAEWADRAGLRAVRIAPVVAGTLTSLAREALGRGSTGVDVRVRIGEDGSALEASERGSIRMLRPVDVDLGVLVEALTRPISRDERHGESVRLTHEEARAILFGVGVPDREVVIDAARSIRGSDVLALLSPVLQRFVVQVRQSLRFGLDESARAHARLRIEGPGSRIPGLAGMIAKEAGLPLEGSPETGAAFDAPGHPDGDLMTALRCTPPDINLVPESVALSQGERRQKMALAAGVAIACGALGADAMLTEVTYRSVRRELSLVSADADEARGLLELRGEVERRRAGVGVVMGSARETLGDRVSWSALMREIAIAAPREIRLIDLSAGRDAGGPTLTLRAYLLSSGDSAPDPRGVQAFLEDLDASPLCAAVSMGEAQRSMLERRPALQFSAVIRPQPLPAVALTATEGP